MFIVCGKIAYNTDHIYMLYIDKDDNGERVAASMTCDMFDFVLTTKYFTDYEGAFDTFNEIIAAYERGEKVYRVPEEFLSCSNCSDA